MSKVKPMYGKHHHSPHLESRFRRHLNDQVKRLDNAIKKRQVFPSTTSSTAHAQNVFPQPHEQTFTNHQGFSSPTRRSLKRPRRNAFVIHDPRNIARQSSPKRTRASMRPELPNAGEVPSSRDLTDCEDRTPSSSYSQTDSSCRIPAFAGDVGVVTNIVVGVEESLNILNRGLSRIKLLESSSTAVDDA